MESIFGMDFPPRFGDMLCIIFSDRCHCPNPLTSPGHPAMGSRSFGVFLTAEGSTTVD